MRTQTPGRLLRPRTLTALAAAGLLTFGAAACSDDQDTSTSADSDQTTTTMASSDDVTSTTDMADGGEMMQPSGPACSAVPADGAGSFSGMAEDPAATAASNNPVLSTLVSAVKAAGLVDTLNGPGPFTIFAPTNDAFAKIPAADLQAVLDDTPTLTKILTLHVISGSELSSADLLEEGSATSVEGEDLTFTKSADGGVEINGMASTVCADVHVANATVHIIDSVLMPAS